jgi:hypothetical protein
MDLFQSQKTIGVIFANQFNNPPLVKDLLDWIADRHDDVKVISAESSDNSAIARDWCIEQGYEYELTTIDARAVDRMIRMIEIHRPDYILAFQEDADVTRAVRIADDLGCFTLIVTRWRERNDKLRKVSEEPERHAQEGRRRQTKRRR